MNNFYPKYKSLDEIVSDRFDDSVIYASVKSDWFENRIIQAGDWVIIDKARKPISNNIVLCRFGNRFSFLHFGTVKTAPRLRLATVGGQPIKDTGDLPEIIGVVTHVLKTVCQ